MNDRHRAAVNSLTSIVEGLYDQTDGGEIPRMELPLRSKKNIEFDPGTGVWRYGDLRTTRTAKTVQGAQMMLRTAYTAGLMRVPRA